MDYILVGSFSLSNQYGLMIRPLIAWKDQHHMPGAEPQLSALALVVGHDTS